MLTRLSIVDQLNQVYYDYETWHNRRLPVEELTRYHRHLIKSGNLITCLDQDENLLGYAEFLRITRRQWSRIIFGLDFYVMEESIRDGPICHVHNGWIHPLHRRGKVFNTLGQMLLRDNSDCHLFSENPGRRPNVDPKIFTRQALQKRFKNFGW